VWENSVSYSNIRDLMQRTGKIKGDMALSDVPDVRDYSNAVTELKQEMLKDQAKQQKIIKKRAFERQKAGNVILARTNEKRLEKVENYKQTVVKMLGLQRLEQAEC